MLTFALSAARRRRFGESRSLTIVKVLVVCSHVVGPVTVMLLPGSFFITVSCVSEYS